MVALAGPRPAEEALGTCGGWTPRLCTLPLSTNGRTFSKGRRSHGVAL